MRNEKGQFVKGCGFWTGKRRGPQSEEWVKNRSNGMIGKNTWMLGRKLSLEIRKKMSQTHKKRVLEGKNNFWKGGKTQEQAMVRSSFEYSEWRRHVFQRDNHTCQACGIRNRKGLGVSIKLEADHELPFSKFPNLRFEILNGRTLCVSCHKKMFTHGRPRKPTTYEEIYGQPLTLGTS